MLLTTVCCKLSSAIAIIPRPNHIREIPGLFMLSSRTTIIYSDNVSNEAELLQRVFNKEFNLILNNRSKSFENSINLVLNPSLQEQIGQEGYKLIVNKDNIKITGATKAGIFYGIQTLRQLLMKWSDNNLMYFTYTIPCVEIIDQPRFKWRGFMLDVSRYFKGVDVIKSILDEMALMKMNVFHWHLTDDQGWRVPIKKYPNLITIGSKRDSSMYLRQKDENGKWVYTFDGVPHEGFYTREEIKDIIAYASALHITIVPEIDMPSHNQAAMAAYPWLGTKNKEIDVPTVFFGQPYEINPSEVNLANPKVINFFEDVLKEVIDLFPSEIIHIGGDEVWFDLWKESPEINHFMEKRGFTTYVDLQMWFISNISKYLKSNGKRMMGWNDITGDHTNENLDADDFRITINDKLATGSIINFWRGDLNLIYKSASKGYDIVNSDNSYTYLSNGYTQPSLEKAYAFDPVPKGLDSQYRNKILGLTCHLWSEWVPNETKLNYLLYPRLAAYAEVGWTNKPNKNFDLFNEALIIKKEHWDMELPTYLRQ